MYYKKVACLYRVSTKMQVEDDDIPTQRKACLDFIKSKQDWKFEREYLEKGVSGYKKSIKDRDVLQTIKSDAIKKEFDILLVFMFDRLGRKEDETPFVVQWFDKQGIEVWSVNEGQQKFEGQADKLINYIRFWQSQGESEKTAIRVREKHTQMIEEGKKWTGGVPPYGYKLVPTTEINSKGRVVKELIIDEEESNIVKLIYNFVYKQGWGGYRIARYLNTEKIPSRKGGEWSSAVINYMTRNPIYKGYIAYSKTSYKGKAGRRNPKDWVISKKQNLNWVIIEEKIWDTVQEIRTSRTPSLLQFDNLDYETRNFPNQTKTDLLFIGMIKCGECGSSICSAKSPYSWNLKNGEKHRAYRSVYKCHAKADGMHCSGQYTYSKKKVEETVLEEVYSYLDRLEKKDLSNEYELRHINDTQKEKNEISLLRMNLKPLENKLKVLKAEVVSSIQGTSKFTPDLLQSLILETQEEIKQKEERVEKLEQVLELRKIEHENIKALQDKIPEWREVFNTSDIDEKKMMLPQLINTILIYHDHIQINFRIDINKFTHCIEKTKSNFIEKTITIPFN